MPDRSPKLTLLAPTASAEEAAAIVAAIERFMRATGQSGSPCTNPPDPWRRAAILEGVGREDREDVPDPWINT
jgi:hypothetical protein